MSTRAGALAGFLTFQLLAGQSFAAGDTSILAPGQTRMVRAAVVYRDIRVCNDTGSAGDLTVLTGASGPLRLAPGMCEWHRGDGFTLRNDSAGVILATYKVETCSGAR
ncbi:MAG TPA: hypothetical protein VFA23_13185 [Dongiaceae bacterium]|nr:hypothetical protein [Dongiaceae bacterium]